MTKKSKENRRQKNRTTTVANVTGAKRDTFVSLDHQTGYCRWCHLIYSMFTNFVEKYQSTSLRLMDRIYFNFSHTRSGFPLFLNPCEITPYQPVRKIKQRTAACRPSVYSRHHVASWSIWEFLKVFFMFVFFSI